MVHWELFALIIAVTVAISIVSCIVIISSWMVCLSFLLLNIRERASVLYDCKDEEI